MKVLLFCNIFFVSMSFISYAMDMQRRIVIAHSSNPINLLMEGASQGDIQKISAALQNGAALDSQDQQGLTALHHALFDNKSESIDFLLNNFEKSEFSKERFRALCIKAALLPQTIGAESRYSHMVAFHPFRDLILTASAGGAWEVGDYLPRVELWDTCGECRSYIRLACAYFL